MVIVSAEADRARPDAMLVAEVAIEMARVVPSDRRHYFFHGEERILQEVARPREPNDAPELHRREPDLAAEQMSQMR